MFTQDMKDMSRILHDLLSVWFSVGTNPIFINIIYCLLLVPYGERKLEVYLVVLIFQLYSAPSVHNK
jgi:hypothetical protein